MQHACFFDKLSFVDSDDFFELQHETLSSKLILFSLLKFLEKSKLRDVIPNPNRAIKEKERSIFFISFKFFQK